MFKVVLVDDEIWSLEGIRKLFEWEKMGFTVAAQATDAAEALELISGIQPDLVITDIRMPEMSGIELLQEARARGIQSEFVIISGFAEFEYAQEALRYGAFDYQLKPIDPCDAKKLLHKLKLHLDEKRMERHARLYHEWSQGLQPSSGLLRAASFQPAGEDWQAATVLGSAADQASAQLAACGAGLNCLVLKVRPDKTVLIFNGDRSLEREIGAAIGGWSGRHEVYIGLSSVGLHEDDLPRLLKEADMAAARYFIDETPGVARYTAASSFRVESVALKIEKWIMLKDYTEISRLLDTLPATFRNERLGIYHVTCMWNQLAVIIGKRLDNGSGTGAEFLDYAEIVHRFRNLDELCSHMKELLKQICCVSGKGAVKSNAFNENIISLLEYVNENFNKELSLSELSEKYFLNMSYCSELFKKVSGYTFSDYVTKLRMEAAAELLQSGRYTADRVGQMTGYKDYYYFSKMFKKFHGLPPSQFTGKTS